MLRKMKKKERKIIEYQDEKNDEFSTAKITPRTIDEHYPYVHKSKIWNAGCYLCQNILSIPLKYGYAKIKFHLTYIGKENIKPYQKQGYFLYGNHTQAFADTFISSNAIYPKRNFFIVNPENVSMKGLGNFVQLLGAIPIPNHKKGMKPFLAAIQDKIKRGYSVTIFPEAHIWPYYTKIRPFSSVSFGYPVEENVPCFCITNTYQARGRKNDKVKIVSYIDGPFYPDNRLSKAERKKKLRDTIYECMVKRSQNSNQQMIEYRKR